jgi:hypothetical protein
MATLLEKALAEPRKKAVANSSAVIDEKLELAVAYCVGQVNGKQIAAATGYRVGNASTWAGGILVKAVKLGLLVRKP